MISVPYLFSRFSNLLIIFFIFISCENKKNVSEFDALEINNDKNNLDSLSISVKNVEPNTITGFNIVNNSFEVSFLEFSNTSSKKLSIEKKMPLFDGIQIISFMGSSLIDGVPEHYRHYYLIDESISNLNFEFFEGDVLLKNHNNIIVDSIFHDYQSINLTAKNKDKALDDIYFYYETKFKSKKSSTLLLLNEFLFINKIQQSKPLDKRVDDYLVGLKQPIISNMFGNFLYSYAKERFYVLDYGNINSNNYSTQYIDFLSKGLYQYMKQIKNNKSEQFSKAYSWLKTTNYYKENNQTINKELINFNQLEFSKSIQDLKLKTLKGENFEFSKIAKENSSEYYLIDFWATWCVPCISDYKILHKLDIPQNVKIINLSLDKNDDFEKWRTKAINLNQEHTYLIQDEKTNQKLIKLLEINSIPRYILVDKHFNLIEGNLDRPTENDFIKKLTFLTKGTQ